ncbi:hypothetical protein [Arcanobacterium sp. S3PF19]|uniref:DUF7455 domain-containing protein n=1 Tax=Arcanobacterium sp. S3PF19 TaxID=1219585 RepID=UPI00050EA3C6|nr:hypothetical protein [Arcanobacterium sp. S3PF19]KGF06456.1 hypothetical protein HMPREF1631_00225 [Arcanobacterium sp. S3PF19]
MVTALQKELPQTEQCPRLTAADRCDACGARAYMKVILPFGELLFCAHHANEHRVKLAESAVEIIDETHLVG